MTTTATLAGLSDRTLEQALEQNFSDGTLASAVSIVAEQFGDTVERSMLEEAATRLAQVPELLARIAALESALEPFAKATIIVTATASTHPKLTLMGVTADDLARAALTLKENEDAG